MLIRLRASGAGCKSNFRISSSSASPHQPDEKVSSKIAVSSTKLITLYGRNGEIERSRKVFDEMPYRNQVSWNAMLTVLVDSLRPNEARQLFDEMPEKNSRSYTLMISCYSRYGLVDEARELFNSAPHCHWNVFLWTGMVSCYVQNHLPLQGIELFSGCYVDFFELRILPNAYTFSAVLKGCTDMCSAPLAAQIYVLVVKLLNEEDERNVFIQNALIDLHSKLGDLIEAEKIFSRMKWRDLSTCNAIMTNYVRHSLLNEALKLFLSMAEKDVLSWNIVISGLAENGRGEEALLLFFHLLRSSPAMKPNPSTYTIILTICATLVALELGRQVHTQCIKLGLSHRNNFIGNSLISLYAKCGSVEELQQVFIDMPVPDIVSWNSLITGLGQNGLAKKALDVARTMLNSGSFNHFTFIAILTSCSHGGLVDEGMEFFRAMREEYRVEPTMDHFVCVIDMLGRAGRIMDALDFLQRMKMQLNSTAWMTLLSACSVHGNAEVGEMAARELRNLEPDNVATYVMLANVHGKIGRTEESKKVSGLTREKLLGKDPGYSWIVQW